MSPGRSRAGRGLSLAAVAASTLAAVSPASAGDRAGYALVAPAHIEVAAGELAEVSLSITPEAGFSISREGPLRVEVFATDDGAIELPRRRYHRADAADPRARAPRFDLRLRAFEPGSHELVVEPSFWVCRRRICWPVSETLKVEVHCAGADPSP